MKILIIDDDPELCQLLRRYLETQGHEVCLAATGQEGLKLLDSFAPAAVLLDHHLPDAFGLELLPLILERRPEASVLMITGLGSTRDAVAALKNGAENYLEKPFELDELATLLEDLAEKKARPPKKPSSPPRAASHADYLFLKSPAMQELYARLREAAAQVQVNVLIEGETGTGKEHAARMLHDFSPRAAGPFVELHCAALPESLLESELFGYESGAFTGATRSKPGLMEQAQGGTLFLDEIGELPLNTQAKLLKVLEERQLRRLGSVKPLALDLRLVTAGNRDLELELKLKRFRADLYYRLNVVRLQLPPLRGRGEDIEALALHFFDRFRADFNKPLKPLNPALLQRLKAQPWPGNVRELRNALERAVLQARGDELSVQDLGLEAQASPGQGQPDSEGLHTDAAALRQTMEEFRWNRSLAARHLGISRPTLLKWLKRHELL
jgi:two-component system response regulator AtoC